MIELLPIKVIQMAIMKQDIEDEISSLLINIYKDLYIDNY